MKTIKLSGANMYIDLISQDSTSWKQMRCPWNDKEKTNTHKCAIKNVSICKYFQGIGYKDVVLCGYQDKSNN